MISQPHALIAAAAPMISLAAALPRHYITRPVINDSGVHLPSIDQQQTNAKYEQFLASRHNTDSIETGQCTTHGEFTYYSERPLPGAEAESILIEECDPSNPNQTRFTYVANKSIKGKMSPTSILIGCTSISPTAFAPRQDGAFARVGAGGYTNFIKRGLAQPTGMSTLAARKPIAVKKGPKRSVEEGEELLVRRWESRSDIDGFSDGYHTCRSAPSSACRLVMKKQACPELEQVFKKTQESVQLDKRFACTPDGVKGIKCPKEPIGGPFTFPKQPILIKREVQGEAKAMKKLASSRTTEQEHNDFMRRWLQGDEHPRSFQARSEEPLQKRSVGLEDAYRFRQMARDEAFRGDYDLHGLRDHDDNRSHHPHEDHDTCSDFSDRNDPRCRLMNRYAGLQQKRDLNVKQGEVLEGQMAKRYVDYDSYSDCTDLSDQYRAECKGARAQGIRYVKRSQDAGLNKRSAGVDDKAAADEMQKTWHGSDRDSVQSFDSHNSRSSRGRFRQRDVVDPADQAMVKRSNGVEGGEDQLDKRSRYSGNSRHSGRSRSSYNRRRALQDDVDDAMEKRSHHSRGSWGSRNRWHRRDVTEADDALEKRSHHGRGRRSRSWDRRDVTAEGDELVEKRSHYSGQSRGSRNSRHRRDLFKEDEDVLEKRSNRSGRSRGSRRSWHRRDVAKEGEDALEKRSNHSARSQSTHNRYRSQSRSSRNRYRREVKVEVDVLGKRDALAPRDLADDFDDGMTVRSVLSEHGDIFERGQDSYTEVLGKRQESFKDETMSKRLVIGRDADEAPKKRDCK
jgi:hypothetical protein